MDDVSVHDHVRPTAAALPAGVWRVVGTDESAVTLLRVTDAEGRRRSTGDVERVDRDTLATGFEPAGNPDGDGSLRRGLANAGSGLYWNVRSAVVDPTGHAAQGLLAGGVLGLGVGFLASGDAGGRLPGFALLAVGVLWLAWLRR